MENKEIEMKNLGSEELEKAVGGNTAPPPPPPRPDGVQPHNPFQPQGMIIGYRTRCPMCGSTRDAMNLPDGQKGNIMFCCGRLMQIVEPIYK